MADSGAFWQLLHHLRLLRWRQLGLAVVAAALAIVLTTRASPAAKVSNYDLAQAASFNQIDTYPIAPLPSSPQYRPNGGWIGRLILPSVQEYAETPGDWVWFEVWHSPEGSPALLGQTLRLTWQPTVDNTTYLATVTRDIAFSTQAEQALETGNIVPVRLNGRKQVGPLQSLAGARPKDDVTVRLFDSQVKLVVEQGQPVLQTNLEPFQLTGREYGLVQILEPDTTVKVLLPTECPEGQPCPTEYFRVQHFNAATKDFSGPIDTIRIPQQPRLNSDRFFSTIRDLTSSPAGSAGWYVYGSRDRDGMFTVQAIKPRSLVQLQPDQVVLGFTEGLNYIQHQNWRREPQRQGNLQRVLVSPTSGSADQALAQWQENDIALIIYLFGGIGGENKEPTPGGTVTGHFAYGLARVVREPIAQELQFNVLYQQIYANNPGGIIAGTHDWESFTGNMERGWLGIRPISEVAVKLDAFTTEFRFGDTTISLFGELLTQAQVLAARYRTGDGTGVALVTPATSCVQDSNQALYIAIEQIKRQIREDPDIVAWVKANPDSPVVASIPRFIAVGEALKQMLTPYGVVRPDWKNNAESLAGILPPGDFTSPTGKFKGLASGILSWQTMMPRWGHDEVARVFLANGAQLWFMRTNVVGGDDPRVAPIPPTGLFGLIPGVGIGVQRFTDAVVTWPSWGMVGVGALALGLYTLGALPFGLSNRFLKRQRALGNPLSNGLHALRLFFVPALAEEIVFRALLLPHPVEGVASARWLLWAVVSTGAFMLFHWLLGKTLRHKSQDTFCDRRFLTLVGWLGLTLAGVYWITGSLWLITGIHWMVAVAWILGLGGRERLANGGSGTRDRRGLWQASVGV